MHNTHNGEIPGHVRFGDSPEPGTDPWAEAEAKEAAEAAAKEAQLKLGEGVDIGLESDNMNPHPKKNKMNMSQQMAEVASFYSDSRAENEYDNSYLQVDNNLSSYIDEIQSPEDLVMVESGWKRGANRIYDADGDGVEDNVKRTRDELDRFYEPAVFGVAEEINNTRHGNLPGHIQREFYEMQSAPQSMDLVRNDWVRK